jgi:hypothetical protein
MLVWATEPALAAYKGRLPSGDPLTVEIGTLPGNAGPTAVRVTYLSKRGERVEFGTVPAGSDAKVVDEQPIPRGTKLIIVEIDNPVGGGALLRVIDALGSYIYDEAVLFDDRYVYEVFDY